MGAVKKATHRELSADYVTSDTGIHLLSIYVGQASNISQMSFFIFTPAFLLNGHGQQQNRRKHLVILSLKTDDYSLMI